VSSSSNHELPGCHYSKKEERPLAWWTNWTRGSCEYHIAAIACRTRLTLLRMLFLIFGSIGGVIFVIWWMFTVSKWFQAWEDEPIIRYSIDVPKPAGDGTALENPSIKVGSLLDLQSVLTHCRLLVQQQYSVMRRRLASSLDS
jgi:hypothetical protein